MESSSSRMLRGYRSLQSSNSTTNNNETLPQPFACASAPLTVATDYNTDPAVLPFVGYMFAMEVADRSLDILTLELDVRLDLLKKYNNNQTTDSTTDDALNNYTINTSPAPLLVNNIPLTIEVYYKLGEFETSVSDATAWQLVARTAVVTAPLEGGVILPTYDFTPTFLAANHRYSWYVTIANLVPLLDYTVYALDKTNELAEQTPDFTLYVGAGLSDTTAVFPPAGIDKIVDPKFTGVIHYNINQDCQAVPTLETTVEFQFLLSAAAPSSVDLSQIVDETIQAALTTPSAVASSSSSSSTPPLTGPAQALPTYVTTYGLTLQDGSTTTEPVTYDGGCPVTWSGCLTTYQSTVVTLEHSETLTSDQVQYATYGLSTTVNDAVQAQLATHKIQVYSLGFTSLAAHYDMPLLGVSTELSAAQQEYFAITTAQFLDTVTGLVTLFDLTIESQSLTNARTRQLQTASASNGALQLSGTMLAAKRSYLNDSTVESDLEALFATNMAQYSQMLSQNVYLPGPIPDAASGAAFAQVAAGPVIINITDSPEVRGEVVPGLDSTQSGGGSNSKNKTVTIAVVAAIVGVIVVGAILFIVYLKLKKDAKKKLDEENEICFEQEQSRQSRPPTPPDTAYVASYNNGSNHGSNNNGSTRTNIKRSDSFEKAFTEDRRQLQQRAKSVDDINITRPDNPRDVKTSPKSPKTPPSLSNYLGQAKPANTRPTEARTVGPGIRPPSRSNSFDGALRPHMHPAFTNGPKSEGGEPPRGVQRSTSSNSTNRLSANNSPNTRKNVDEPPSRVVQRANSSDNMYSPSSRPNEGVPSRGVQRSKSSNETYGPSSPTPRRGVRPKKSVNNLNRPLAPSTFQTTGSINNNGSNNGNNPANSRWSSDSKPSAINTAAPVRRPPQRAKSYDGYTAAGAHTDRVQRPPTRQNSGQSGRDNPSLNNHFSSQPRPSAPYSTESRSLGPGVIPPSRGNGPVKSSVPSAASRATNGSNKNGTKSNDDFYLPRRPSLVKKMSR